MKLYLDDVRTPQVSGYDPADWVVVRDEATFLELASRHAEELVAVSLDHDLGVNAAGELERTGYDALKAWIERQEPDPTRVEVLVHSANPVGAENIRAYWRSWCRHWGQRG